MIIKTDFPALLPAGIHTHSLDSLKELCITAFPESVIRPSLFQGLNVFIGQIQSLGIIGNIWIDGSFMTSKSDPSDIDAVLLIDSSNINNLSVADQNRFRQLIDKANAFQRFGIDIYVIDRESTEWTAYWRGFFGYCRDGRTPKGIAEVIL